PTEGRTHMHELEHWSIGVPGSPHDAEVHSLVHDDADRERLPVVLWLHGAMSSAESLDLHVERIRRRWDAGVVPPAIVTCVSTPTSDGFYPDAPAGGWETLVGSELGRATAERYGADPGRIALFGASMGGYGVLKLLFASPNGFLGGVAISPAIFPGDTV